MVDLRWNGVPAIVHAQDHSPAGSTVQVFSTFKVSLSIGWRGDHSEGRVALVDGSHIRDALLGGKVLPTVSIATPWRDDVVAASRQVEHGNARSRGWDVAIADKRRSVNGKHGSKLLWGPLQELPHLHASIALTGDEDSLQIDARTLTNRVDQVVHVGDIIITSSPAASCARMRIPRTLPERPAARVAAGTIRRVGLTCASGEIRLHARVPACAAAALADPLWVHRVETLCVRQRIETISSAHVSSTLAVQKDEQWKRIAGRSRVWDLECELAAHIAEVWVVESDAVASP